MIEIAKAYLVPIGIPTWSKDAGSTAVWKHDDITILRRAGSHYFCLVEYGVEGYRESFRTWIHKRNLKRREVQR